MSSKDELKGGLSALLGGAAPQQAAAPDNITPTPTDTEAQATEQTATPQEEEELINSVDDEELKIALRARQMIGRGRPKQGDGRRHYAEGYGRICTIANIEKWNKIRRIALQETLQLKEVVDAAFGLAIERYEATHGEIILPDNGGDASKIFK